MAITDEQWMSFLTMARLSQPAATLPPTTVPIVGRFIVQLAARCVDFYVRHRGTLDPVLSQLAIAALNALAAAMPDIKNVNPPGPD